MAHKTLIATALAAALLAGCSTEMTQQIVDGVKQNLNARGLGAGGKAVDDNQLRNLMPQFDPGKPVGQQWPHVAVTVLKSPPMWADLGYDSHAKRWYSGCHTLKLKIWSSATVSRDVGPFDFCSPRDLEVKPGMGGMTEANFNSIVRPMDLPFMTGIERTEGPNPPRSLAPEDNASAQLQMRNSSSASSSNLSKDNISKFGTMFWNLRNAMGSALTQQDFRVWIVKIE